MLLKHQGNVKADEWELVEFPATMEDGEPMWPEYWKKDELEKVEATLPTAKWNAQWMQKTDFRRRRFNQTGMVAQMGQRLGS